MNCKVKLISLVSVVFPYICDVAWSTFSHIGVIPSSCTFVLRLTSLTLPLVLATSSTLRRNNGANCFASVQRKLVLTGARAMIHTLDLRDARVRVAGARFTLPTSLNEKSNSPEIFASTRSGSKFQRSLPIILVGILVFIFKIICC